MREFSVGDGGVTIEGASTLVFVNNDAAPGQALDFLRAWVGQSANATSAQQRVELETQVTAFPTLTSATPQALKLGDAISNIANGGVLVSRATFLHGLEAVGTSRDERPTDLGSCCIDATSPVRRQFTTAALEFQIVSVWDRM